jgi:hypothetical protein
MFDFDHGVGHGVQGLLGEGMNLVSVLISYIYIYNYGGFEMIGVDIWTVRGRLFDDCMGFISCAGFL